MVPNGNNSGVAQGWRETLRFLWTKAEAGDFTSDLRRFPGSDVALSRLIRMIEDHGWSGDNMADRRQLFVEMSEY